MAPPEADPLREDFLELVRREYGCNATLEGSGSLVAEGAEPPPLPPYAGDPAEIYADFLPPEVADQPSPPHMWFTVVDSRGRIRWTEKHPDWDVLVLVCRSTPADYLGYLRRERVCYLLAGDDRVDLRRALVAMATKLRSPLRAVDGRRRPQRGAAAGRADRRAVAVTLVPSDSLEVWERRRCWTGRRWPSATGRRRCGCCSVHTDVGGTVRLRYLVATPGRAYSPRDRWPDRSMREVEHFLP